MRKSLYLYLLKGKVIPFSKIILESSNDFMKSMLTVTERCVLKKLFGKHAVNSESDFETVKYPEVVTI